MYTTIKTLWERTKNNTEIARITSHDWKTVAKCEFSGVSGHLFRIYPDSVPATCGHLADVRNSTAVELSFQ